MMQTVTFRSLKGNSYLYSPSLNRISLCHPIVQHLYEQSRAGIDLRAYINSIREKGSLNLGEETSFSPEEVEYQYRKYLFLTKAGYFKPKERMNLDGKLRPVTIEENLGQLKQFIFEVTEDCNLSCTYCAYSKFYVNKERSRENLDVETAKKTLDYILKVRKNPEQPLIISFYGGEPLKNMTFIREVISYLYSIPGNKTPFRFNMTSNGIYVKKYIDFLVEHSFELGISLDGDATGNAYRVLKNSKPSFDLVVKNMDYVREHYPEYFDQKVSFMSVMHNRNNFRLLHEFFFKKYGKIPVVADINTVNINEEYRQEFVETFIKDGHDDRNEKVPMKSFMLRHPRVKDLSDIAERYSGLVFKNHYYMIFPDKKRKKVKKYVPTATCSPMSMRAFMTTDGTILPCEHISRVFELGKAVNGTPQMDMNAIAGMYNGYFEKIKKFCTKCYLAENCKECVFNTNIETGKPVCEFFMSEKKFTEYLSKHYSIIENDYKFFLRIAKDAFQGQGL